MGTANITKSGSPHIPPLDMGLAEPLTDMVCNLEGSVQVKKWIYRQRRELINIGLEYIFQG